MTAADVFTWGLIITLGALAVLLALGCRGWKQRPAPERRPPTDRGTKLAGRYWLTDKGYAALADLEQEQQA